MKDVCRILLVEDDEEDRLIFEAALKNNQSPFTLDFAESVPQAKELLEGKEDLPRIVVCDLWLGAENGIDLLLWMKASPKFKLIPFVLIVTTISPGNLSDAYDAGASSCIVKPQEMESWNETIRTLLKWWCEYATTPTGAELKKPSGWKGVPS